MRTINIVLNKFEEIGHFVNIMDRMNGRINLRYGQHIVNARSVVGVATMFGAENLELCIYEHQNVDVERQLAEFLRTA